MAPVSEACVIGIRLRMCVLVLADADVVQIWFDFVLLDHVTSQPGVNSNNNSSSSSPDVMSSTECQFAILTLSSLAAIFFLLLFNAAVCAADDTAADHDSSVGDVQHAADR